MQKDEIENLLSKDTACLENNNIESKTLNVLDELILEKADEYNVSEEAVNIYKKFQPMKQEAPDSMKTVLFSTIKNFANEEVKNNKCVSGLLLYRFLLVKSKFISDDFLNIAKLIAKIDISNNLIKIFADNYLQKEENKLFGFIELAGFYKSINDYKSSIKYYEKFLEIDKTKAVIYNLCADLYSKEYGNINYSLEKQIELYKYSLKLQPDSRLALHGLAFAYEKLGNNNKAEDFYRKLLNNNPTENDLYNYGGVLIHCGDFQNGHKYFTHRFNIDDINLKYPVENGVEKRWDLISDIQDKTLLIHYEQGFGDTIMYSRFVPFMKNYAKKIIFVVQKELFSLLNNSELFEKNINLIPDNIDLEAIKYDKSMALLDCPYVLKTSSDTIPFSNGYLKVPDNLIKEYKNKFITNSKNLKIGIAISGAKDANYNDRNIDLHQLQFLTNLNDVQIYFLQKEYSEKMDNIIYLGETFEDFLSSASAVKNMDLIISTDNVILNLAGALGVKTIGLFNKQTNYRWFKTSGQNVGWYSSVVPLQNNDQNDWTKSLIELNSIICELNK